MSCTDLELADRTLRVHLRGICSGWAATHNRPCQATCMSAGVPWCRAHSPAAMAKRAFARHTKERAKAKERAGESVGARKRAGADETSAQKLERLTAEAKELYRARHRVRHVPPPFVEGYIAGAVAAEGMVLR